MIIKKFKTVTNDNTLVHVEVTLLEGNEEFESAVGIITKRLIPISEIETYLKLNEGVPTFFCLRQTSRYALLVTKSAVMRLSTFDQVAEIVNEFKNR